MSSVLSPFTDNYSFLVVSGRLGYRETVQPEEEILTTVGMESRLQVGQIAYVINHRGYKAHVKKYKNGNMKWHYPPQSYISEYCQDENVDQLKWIIRGVSL